jgi:hypothetical protein
MKTFLTQNTKTVFLVEHPLCSVDLAPRDLFPFPVTKNFDERDALRAVFEDTLEKCFRLRQKKIDFRTAVGGNNSKLARRILTYFQSHSWNVQATPRIYTHARFTSPLYAS